MMEGNRESNRSLRLAEHASNYQKELNLPVFLICQLNRDSVKKGAEPQLHDLRESGQIEQDADVVILLHRDLLGDKEDVKVIVAKNRFGGTGYSKDKIKFKPMCQQFVQAELPPEPRLYDEKTSFQKDLYEEDIDRL